MIEKYSISIQMTKFVQYQLKKLPKIGQFWSKLAKNWTNWMEMGWKSTSKFRIWQRMMEKHPTLIPIHD